MAQRPLVWGSPLYILHPVGAPRSLSPLGAVGSSEYPLWTDGGAPTDVHPGARLVTVGSQADLPWPPPLLATVGSHDAHWLAFRDRYEK